jgi:hypothetical protein
VRERLWELCGIDTTEAVGGRMIIRVGRGLPLCVVQRARPAQEVPAWVGLGSHTPRLGKRFVVALDLGRR